MACRATQSLPTSISRRSTRCPSSALSKRAISASASCSGRLPTGPPIAATNRKRGSASREDRRTCRGRKAPGTATVTL